MLKLRITAAVLHFFFLPNNFDLAYCFCRRSLKHDQPKVRYKAAHICMDNTHAGLLMIIIRLLNNFLYGTWKKMKPKSRGSAKKRKEHRNPHERERDMKVSLLSFLSFSFSLIRLDLLSYIGAIPAFAVHSVPVSIISGTNRKKTASITSFGGSNYRYFCWILKFVMASCFVRCFPCLSTGAKVATNGGASVVSRSLAVRRRLLVLINVSAP
jgi:hypothetical protein